MCLQTILLESAYAQESGNFNLWNPNAPRREIPWEARQTTSEDMDRVSRSLQQALTSETQQSRTLLHFAVFLGIAAAVLAGFLVWKMWRQKRKEKVLNDPMFLVYELNSAHQLSEQEKRLMQELSEKHSLPSTLKLFVEPKFLLDAWESEAFASSQPTVRQLLTKLFDIVKA